MFAQWAASKETQTATSYKFPGAYKRSGANRTSLWNNESYRSVLGSAGANFIEAATKSFAEDTDVDWRPRLPQWPAVGDTMATAIQASLVGQSSVKEALDKAQAKINGILKG